MLEIVETMIGHKRIRIFLNIYDLETEKVIHDDQINYLHYRLLKICVGKSWYRYRMGKISVCPVCHKSEFNHVERNRIQNVF